MKFQAFPGNYHEGQVTRFFKGWKYDFRNSNIFQDFQAAYEPYLCILYMYICMYLSMYAGIYTCMHVRIIHVCIYVCYRLVGR